MKSIIILLISFLLISCKSNSKLIGEYKANLSDSTVYYFNLSKEQYIHKKKSGGFSKGKFKTLYLNSEKILIVCNDMTWKRTDGFIKEKNNSADSIVVGVWDGFKNLGSTVFEITSKEKTLLYRKTYTNELQKTDSEGILVTVKAIR